MEIWNELIGEKMSEIDHSKFDLQASFSFSFYFFIIKTNHFSFSFSFFSKEFSQILNCFQSKIIWKEKAWKERKSQKHAFSNTFQVSQSKNCSKNMNQKNGWGLRNVLKKIVALIHWQKKIFYQNSKKWDYFSIFFSHLYFSFLQQLLWLLHLFWRAK